MNPFRTSEAVDSITQTTTPSGKSDSEMMAEMLRLKGMFQQRCRRKRKEFFNKDAEGNQNIKGSSAVKSTLFWCSFIQTTPKVP